MECSARMNSPGNVLRVYGRVRSLPPILLSFWYIIIMVDDGLEF